ncbi:MAG TPA: hypothetical protein ENK28_11750 [Aliiroseovarius sp.]|nr:hypothetical protein [Aliiroseovarius sp.]
MSTISEKAFKINDLPKNVIFDAAMRQTASPDNRDSGLTLPVPCLDKCQVCRGGDHAGKTL